MSALAELRLRWRAVTVTTKVNGQQLNETIPRHELRLALEALDARDEALLYLDARGGLGHDKHAIIKKALGVPYPEFCHHADKCMGLGSCPRDPCCCD